MLSLGQKTRLRKAIRPLGRLIQKYKPLYSSLKQDVKDKANIELDSAEEYLQAEFDDLRGDMSGPELLSASREIKKLYTEDIPGENNKDQLSLEDIPTFPREESEHKEEEIQETPKPVGCFGQQIEKRFKPLQETMNLGD